jgi:CheY-like chemotaxis protein
VQIVLTDVNMPGDMDGLAFAREILCRWPLVAINVTSGKATIDIEVLPAIGYFMPKPYTAADLIDTLQVLAA